MNFFQGTLQAIEVGKGSFLVRLVPLFVALAILLGWMDLSVYQGLDDPQSMDNAQLARQIVRGKGFTTEFLRPHAVAQLRDYLTKQKLSNELFPAVQFPPGTPRVIPDTYNAPGYPYLLALWFRLIHPEFGQTSTSMGETHRYEPERWIPLLNQLFLLMTAGIVFLLGKRLFDDRVAWMSLVAFLATDLIWQYSLTGLSTTVLMFLAAAVLYCVQEIFGVGEDCFNNEEASFARAWVWGILLALLLVAISLTRLQLLVLLVPVIVVLLVMPSARLFLPILIAVVVLVAVAPWYYHLYKVSGSFFGSNGPLLLHGTEAMLAKYEGNEIYCATTIPGYEQIFRDASRKEYLGFLWSFAHSWALLGSSPLILLFGASILHQFKRRRTRLFHWLLFGCAVVIIIGNSLGEAKPEALGPWNSLVILFPAMLVVGCAFFFILLDRLALSLWLLNNIIVTAVLALTALPLVAMVTSSSFYPFHFPPYWPPAIKTVSGFAQPDEWVTTDMPWATAWYGDRASLWLPDSVTDFESFHDNVCPTGVIVFTPVTWGKPVAEVKDGEYKEWMPLALGTQAPADFPLAVHTGTGFPIPNYTVWSDRARWEK